MSRPNVVNLTEKQSEDAMNILLDLTDKFSHQIVIGGPAAARIMEWGREVRIANSMPPPSFED